MENINVNIVQKDLLHQVVWYRMKEYIRKRSHLNVFTAPSSLVSHERIHTKEKPFKCRECNRSFTQRSHLKNHINQIHTNNGKYQCKYCPKRFSIPTDLERH
eukprot:343473_1